MDPPSYESLFQEISDYLGVKPSTDRVLAAFDKFVPVQEALSSNEVSESGPPEYRQFAVANNVRSAKKAITLASREKVAKPALKLTKEERQALTDALTQISTSVVTKKHLLVTAESTSKLCREIDEHFSKLKVELNPIDAKNLPPPQGAFVPRLDKVQRDFRQVLPRSKDLAMGIAVYAKRFDNVILPLCLDRSIQLKVKLSKVDEFIEKSKDWVTKTETQKEDLIAVRQAFLDFIASFEGWAKVHDKNQSTKIAQLNSDMENLNLRIEGLAEEVKSDMWKAAGLGLLGVCCMLAGPIGVLGAVLAFGSVIYVGFDAAAKLQLMQGLKNEINQKRQEIDAITKSLDENGKLRQTLANIKDREMNGDDKLTDKLDAIQDIWAYAKADAQQIKLLLEYGHGDIRDELPSHLILSTTGQVTGIYRQLATYLEAYANGIEEHALKPISDSK